MKKNLVEQRKTEKVTESQSNVKNILTVDKAVARNQPETLVAIFKSAQKDNVAGSWEKSSITLWMRYWLTWKKD